MVNLTPEQIPVVIFCGGRTVSFHDNQEKSVKAAIKINNKTMLEHIINMFCHSGFKKFILCGGYQCEKIEDIVKKIVNNAEFTIIDTGTESKTGERLNKVRDLLKNVNTFAVSYSDTLSTIDLGKLLEFHIKHKKIATMVAAHMPTRFRILGMRPGENSVRGFAEKPVIMNDWINGGFYFFNKALLEDENIMPSLKPKLILEDLVLENLASIGELIAYQCDDEWQHIDNERDFEKLNYIVETLEKQWQQK